MTTPAENIIDAESFDFAIDYTTRDEIVLALTINSTDGKHHIVPMDMQTAQNIGEVLLGHVDLFRHASQVAHAAR